MLVSLREILDLVLDETDELFQVRDCFSELTRLAFFRGTELFDVSLEDGVERFVVVGHCIPSKWAYSHSADTGTSTTESQ